MPIDQQAAARIRAAVADLALEPSEQILEKRMFGGLCMLLNGSILVGVSGKGILMRLSGRDMEALLKLPGAQPMEMRERTAQNFAFVDPETLSNDKTLDYWLEKSLTYVRKWRREEAAKASGKRG